MPKIFEYLGILIFFYSNEHEPIHVHAKKGEFESKAEFYIINGVDTYSRTGMDFNRELRRIGYGYRIDRKKLLLEN